MRTNNRSFFWENWLVFAVSFFPIVFLALPTKKKTKKQPVAGTPESQRQDDKIAQNQLNPKLSKSAHELVMNLGIKDLRESPKKLISNEFWRIDMQGTRKKPVKLYYIQLQLNVSRQGAKHRTTFAALLVLLLDDIPATDEEHEILTSKDLRDGLWKSFNSREMVKIEVICGV